MTCPLDIQPYDQSQAVVTPPLGSLNYTNQDYWSLKNRIRTILQQKFPNDFNDLIESSLAIMLIEMYAFLADLLSFKMDQNVNEVFIDTVTEVDNAFRLAKLVGFDPTPPIAARAMFSATLSTVLAVDLTIPAGASFNVANNNQNIYFELFPADSNNNPILDEDIVITAGSFTNTAIIGLEGRTFTDGFVGTGLGAQNYLLTNAPVLFDSIRVSVDGIRWNQVDFFSAGTPLREYRIEFDSSYNAYIIFGDNTTGLAPTKGSQIDVTYRVGGGTVGNIITGFINTSRNIAVDGFNFGVPVQFFNYTPGQFGYDGDGIEDIRQKLPLWIRVQGRCVTGEDYKTTADQFATPYHGQIGKSTAVLRNYGCAANIVDVYVLALVAPNSLEKASDDLKADLLEKLNGLKMLTDFVCIRDGLILNVDVVVDVTIDKVFKNLKDELTIKINNAINGFFDLGKWDYGQILRDSDLMKALTVVKEVQQSDASFTTTDPNNSGAIVTSKFNEIIRPDTITLNFNFV